MINGLEGIPGSGKSYEAVVYHVLLMLAQGRKVITNLPLFPAMFGVIDPAYVDLLEIRRAPAPVLGTWDSTRVDSDGNGEAFRLFENGQGSPGEPVPVRVTVDSFNRVSRPSEKNDVLFGGVWDYYSTWKHPKTGQGPVFIIDECHDALPAVGIDPQVLGWFKLHRHFNADVLLMTQNFRDMNQPVARLCAMMVKVRKADILGKPDHYIRKVHAGYRGAVISTEERKYKPEYFPLYKSHSQGNSVSESAAGDVKPFIVKFKRFSRVFYILTAIFCVYAAWRFFNPPSKVVAARPGSSAPGAAAPGSVSSGAVAPVAASPGAVAPVAASPGAMAPFAENEIPEPYATKGLHLTGRMTIRGRAVYLFAVSSGNQRIFDTVSSDDLKAMGFRWQPLTDCAGTLRWKGNAKSITCDAPVMASGSTNNPVVITLPAGSVTPTARSDGLRVASGTL